MASPETPVTAEPTDKAPKRRRATKKAAKAPADTPYAADATETPVAPSDAEGAAPTAPPSEDPLPVAPDVAPDPVTDDAALPTDPEPVAEEEFVVPVEAVEDAGEGDEDTDEAVNENEQAVDEDEEPADAPAPVVPSFGLLFQAPDTTVVRRPRRAIAPAQPAPPEVVAEPETLDTEESAVAVSDDSADDTGGESGSRRRRRGGRGRRARTGADSDEAPDGESAESTGETEIPDSESADQASADEGAESSRRRRRRRRSASGVGDNDDPPGTVTKVREPRPTRDEPTAVKGSTRLEAKKQRRRDGREAGRRRTIITEAEFLARRESVERVMVVRGTAERTQIGILEDGVLVEHYVSRETSTTMVGNVYLGRVQNVLPSMEAAFVDIGKGRNAVLYAGEVNWDAAGLEGGQAKRIENALTSGDTVLVQVTKDPIGHKGARLTSQISLPGRFLVFVPEGAMTGISRKLPDTERARLKAILKEIVPDSAGVIVRTAAEGASEEELRADVERLTKAWAKIQKKAHTASHRKSGSGGAPTLVHGEPDLTVRVIRDIFTEDFAELVVSGERAWAEVSDYVDDVAPDLAQRLTRWTSEADLFTHYRVQEQLAKAMDRKVWLPSGGSLVIDRTEAMTVVDVNTGKFVGSGGNLEETVTKNNIEAAEEIVRQLRLRDIGGIIVIDFIDMVLESNRDLVVRRLLECLGRDRTKHQVAEVTSLGLVQMTRKRVGSGLIEVFSETCEACNGRGILVHTEPVESAVAEPAYAAPGAGSGSRGRGRRNETPSEPRESDRKPSGPTAAQIAAAAHAAAVKTMAPSPEVATTDITEAPEAVAVPNEPETGVLQPADPGQGPDAAGETPDAAPSVSEPLPEVTEVLPTAIAPEFTVEPSGETTDPAPEQHLLLDVAAAPATRPRRRRGRVVAPAGPPRVVPDPPAGDPPADSR